MKIKVKLTVDDYWNYDKYMVTHTFSFFVKILISLGIIPVAIFVTTTSMGLSILKVLIATLLGGLIFDFGFLYFAKRRMAKLLINSSGYIAEHSFEIFNEGLKRTIPAGGAIVKWSTITSIVQNRKYIYYFINKTNPLILPKRGFEREEEAIQFYNKSVEAWSKFKK